MKYVLISTGGDGATFTTDTPICVFSDKALARKVADTLMSQRGKKQHKNVDKDLSFSVTEVPDYTDGVGSDPVWIAKTLADKGLCS